MKKGPEKLIPAIEAQAGNVEGVRNPFFVSQATEEVDVYSVHQIEAIVDQMREEAPDFTWDQAVEEAIDRGLLEIDEQGSLKIVEGDKENGVD